MTFRSIFLVAALLACVPMARAEDVVLVGGTIVDGSGKPGVQGNIRILSGEIDEIGPFRPRANETTIDVKGLVIAPGFLDLDNHSTGVLDANLDAVSQITQGITTAALGLDGEGPISVEAFMSRFDENEPAFNILTFAGHNTVRRQVMGPDTKRAATPAEIQKMEQFVEAAMRQGAFGLSVNLESGPGSFSTIEELTAIAKIVARYGGILVCHLRSEGRSVVDATREAIDIARRAKVPVHISHLKLSGVAVWGQADAVLGELNKAKNEGLDVTADVFPYNSVESDIASLVPAEASDAEAITKSLDAVGGPKGVLVIEASNHPEYSNKTLSEIAAEGRTSPAGVYAQIVRDGGGRVLTSSMSEKDVRSLLVYPSVVVASDAGIDDFHPRGAGTFPHVLGPLVRDEKVMTLETAVRKMSALPAGRLGLKQRGVLQKGAAADIVVFDPARIRDKATAQDPTALSEGMKYVFVNGVLVLRDGQPTAKRPGVALR